MEYIAFPGLSDEVTRGLVIGIQTVFGVAGSVGFASNILLIVSVLRRSDLRASPTYITLVSLATSDAFVLLFLPFFLYTVYYGNATDMFVCRCFMYGVMAAQGCSIYHLVIFSVLRYIILVKPLFALRHVTVKATIAVCGVVWMLALCGGVVTATVVVTAVFNSSYTNQTASLCVIQSDSYGYMFSTFIILSFLPLAVIALFHVIKAYRLRRGAVKFANSGNRKQVSSKLIFAILVLFIITTFPSGIGWSVIINNPQWSSLESAVGLYLLTALTYVNSAVNPLLYFYFSKFQTERTCPCLKPRRGNTQ